MPPLGLATAVPSNVVIDVQKTDEKHRVVCRIESVNGSFPFCWGADDARRIAGMLLQSAETADRLNGPGLVVPKGGLPPGILDRTKLG